MTYEMTRQRFIWADSLKGWLMLLVIVGHTIQSVLGDDCNDNHVWNLIYSFHMPAFMAVSGWLAYSPTTPARGESLLKRRFKQLMVPFFVWSFLAYATYGEYTMERLVKIILQPDAYFWFLWVLFFICVLFWGTQIMAKRLRVQEEWVIGSCASLLVIVMVEVNIRVLGFQQVAYYYLFYAMGYLFHKHPKLMVRNIVGLAMLTIIWLTLAWFWQQHGLPCWLPTAHWLPLAVEQYLYRGLTTLIAIVVILSASPRLLDGNKLLNQTMRYLGCISLGLYVVHLSFGGIKIIISGITALCPTISLTPLVVLASLISLVVSTLIVILLMKNRSTAQILFGKLK